MNFFLIIDFFNNGINVISILFIVCYVYDEFFVKFGWVIVYSVIILVLLFGNIFIIIVVFKYGRK